MDNVISGHPLRAGQGDFDGDGGIDDNDFLLWQNHIPIPGSVIEDTGTCKSWIAGSWWPADAEALHNKVAVQCVACTVGGPPWRYDWTKNLSGQQPT